VFYLCHVDNSVVNTCIAFNGTFSLHAHCATCYVTTPINHRPVHWRTGMVSTNNERVVLVRLHWPDGLSIPNLKPATTRRNKNFLLHSECILRTSSRDIKVYLGLSYMKYRFPPLYSTDLRITFQGFDFIPLLIGRWVYNISF
jgi:hypothetical protein